MPRHYHLRHGEDDRQAPLVGFRNGSTCRRRYSLGDSLTLFFAIETPGGYDQEVNSDRDRRGNRTVQESESRRQAIMNPESALILGSLGLGLVVSLGIWLLLEDPLRRLEQTTLRRFGPRGRSLSTRAASPVDHSNEHALTLQFEESWTIGEPSLTRYWFQLRSSKSLSLLALLVEADLRNRFLRGERPTVAKYLKQYPKLARSTDRVVAHLRGILSVGENGHDADQFCEHYQPWRDLILKRLGHNPGNPQSSMSPVGASD